MSRTTDENPARILRNVDSGCMIVAFPMSAPVTSPMRIAFADFVLDTGRAALLRDGVEIKLRPQAQEVLRHLLENEGRVVSKQEFFDTLWDGTAVTDGALVQCVIDIRHALGDRASMIRTVQRRGYVFERPADSTVPEPPEAAAVQRRARPWWPIGRREWTMAVLAVILLTAFLERRRIPFVSLLGRPAIQSLAVLPLANLSADGSQDYVADGMTDELITNLARIGSVRVISRTSVMRFKGVKQPLPAIGRELNVDAIIEGTVTRAGNRVRITAQLIDARTDQHLWARSYERDLGDVIALQGELARAIASEVSAQLTPSLARQFTAAPRRNPDVEDAYLQGRYHVNKGSQEEIHKGIELFRQALASDPRDARSHAGLATAFLTLADFYLPSTDMLPQAKDAAIAALAIDDSLSDSHVALGAVRFLYDWDWPGAEREFVRAIDLNPGSADAHIWYAVLLAQAARPDAAFEHVRRAQALDPLSISVHVESGWVFFLSQRPGEALAEWKRVLDLEPNFAFSHTAIWAAYLSGGDFGRVRALTGGRAGDPDTMDLAALIGACATSGNKEEAAALMGRLRRRAELEYICPYEMATAEAVLGRPDEAISWLRKSVAERSACVPSMKTDPRLTSLRSDPRFRDLLRTAKFPD